MESSMPQTPVRHINNRSDFNLIVHLLDKEGIPQAFPSAPFTMTFQAGGPTRYIVRSDDGLRVIRPSNDDNTLLVVFDFKDSPRLGAGQLRCSLDFDEPNDLFPDGTYDFTVPAVLDYEIWDGQTDFVGAVKCDLVLPYVKGDPGKPGDPGQPGEPGEPGKSAYSYAVEAGYDKTEEQFAHTLATAISRDEVVNVVEEDNDNPVTSNATSQAIDHAKAEVTEQGEQFVRIYAQPKYKGTAQTDLYVARGAVYNADTGLYELNGLTDITEDQMREIYLYTASRIYDFNMSYTFSALYIRTNFPVNKRYMANREFTGTFFTCRDIEVIYISDKTGMVNSFNSPFYQCQSLREIMGEIIITPIKQVYFNPFADCRALTTFKLTGVSNNLSLSASPKIDLASMKWMIDNANNISAITITVHPELYAKLTDETGAPEWYALNQLAASRNIAFGVEASANMLLMNDEEGGIRVEQRCGMPEIVAPSGMFLTQEKPLGDPVYVSRRIMLPNESITDWRIASAIEKHEYEKATQPIME